LDVGDLDHGGDTADLIDTPDLGDVVTVDARDGEADGGEVYEPHPNDLDQDSLFVCDERPAASPARIRRIDREEWTRTIGKSVRATYGGSVARQNPFDAPSGYAYSTFSDRVSLDGPTVDLYFSVLHEAGIGWTARYPTGVGADRLHRAVEDRELRCMFNDEAPDDACIDYYLRAFFEDAAYFRPPTDAELAQARVSIADGLARERDGKQDRRQTLLDTTSAIFMTTGALFRDELGTGDPDEDGRYRLGDRELSRALAYLLSDRGPGTSGTFRWGEGPPAHQHYSAPLEGYLSDIKQAGVDGTIQDEAVIRGLVRAHAAGVDAGRYDLMLDRSEDERLRRSQYWVSEKVLRFFREWLGYLDIEVIFKDTPHSTSQFDDGEGSTDYTPIVVSYRNMQAGSAGREPRFIAQLDDVVARIVSEDVEVLEELLTTRRFYVPSNTAYADANFSKSTDEIHRPYNLDVDVEPTRESRWVTLPDDERAGVLTHPAWLGAHGGNFEDDPSLILRGKWLRENLFCQNVPGLELVMVEAQLPVSDGTLSARGRVEGHIEPNQECMGCHTLMNSLGYPFEIYNHAGFLRAEDHGGAPDGSTTIDNAPDGLDGDYDSAIDLSIALSGSNHVKRCFIRQSFRFFMGRFETRADACTLDRMERAYDDSDGSFITMLEALASSDGFLYRSREESQ
jgi:hypothetical protein